MKKILALVDFDVRSKHVMHAAFQMAEQNKAELIVYHQLSKGDQLELDSVGFAIEKNKSLSEAGKMFETAYDVHPTYRFAVGSFKKSVNSLIAEEDIDLVIMGSNGESNVKEKILGSHAAIIMETVSCSVLVLKDEHLNHEINEVVFASSFNEMDKEVFTYFLDFMKLSKDTVIHLLMVDTYSFFNQPSSLVQEVFEDFKELAKPYKAKAHFFHGISVEDGINKFMKEEKADLLIMSNKYSRLLRTAITGSKMVATLHENQYPFLNIDYKKGTTAQ